MRELDFDLGLGVCCWEEGEEGRGRRRSQGELGKEVEWRVVRVVVLGGKRGSSGESAGCEQMSEACKADRFKSRARLKERTDRRTDLPALPCTFKTVSFIVDTSHSPKVPASKKWQSDSPSITRDGNGTGNALRVWIAYPKSMRARMRIHSPSSVIRTSTLEPAFYSDPF